MILNERILRNVVREFFGNQRGSRILLYESEMRQTVILLVEMALSKQIYAFIDEKVGIEFGDENWQTSQERELWVRALDVLDGGLGGKAQEVLHALRLLHAKRRTGEPAEDFLLHDASAAAELGGNMATVRAKSGGRINSISDVNSIEQIHELLETYVRAPGFKHIVPEPVATISGRKIWNIYLPNNPGESCAIARMSDPNITWCTARDKNNMFYGYASRPVWLYYVLEANNPANKYSIGVNGDDKKIMASEAGSVTVDSKNQKFEFKQAFGLETSKIINFIESHASSHSGSTHPGLQDIYRAARSLPTWRTFMKSQSSDADYLLSVFKVIEKHKDTSEDVITDMLVSMAKKLDKADNFSKFEISNILENHVNHSGVQPLFYDEIRKIIPNTSVENKKLLENLLEISVVNNQIDAQGLDTVLLDREKWILNKENVMSNSAMLSQVLKRTWNDHKNIINITQGAIDSSAMIDLLHSILNTKNIDLVPNLDHKAGIVVLNLIQILNNKLNSSLVMGGIVNTLSQVPPRQTLGKNLMSIFDFVIRKHLNGLTFEHESMLEEIISKVANGPNEKNPKDTAVGYAWFIKNLKIDNPKNNKEFTKRVNEAFEKLVELNGSDKEDFKDWVFKYAPSVFGTSLHRFANKKITEKFLQALSFEQKTKVLFDFNDIFSQDPQRYNKFRSSVDENDWFKDLISRAEIEFSQPKEAARKVISDYLFLKQPHYRVPKFDLGPNFENIPKLEIKHLNLKYVFSKLKFLVKELQSTRNPVVEEVQNQIEILEPILSERIKELEKIQTAAVPVQESRLRLSGSALRRIITEMLKG